MSLDAAMLAMPSVSSFVQELTVDLESGRSVLALFPGPVDHTLIFQRMQERLRQQDYDVWVVSLQDLSGESALPTALGHALSVKWQPKHTPRTVENLAACEGLPDVVFLRGHAEAPGDQRGELLALMRRWGAAGQSVEARGKRPCALCLLLNADNLPKPPPQSDLWLVVRWWWARPSALELRLLCRGGVVNTNRELSLSDRWRGNLMPSLVGNDLGLAQHLWDDLAKGTDHVVARLQLWVRKMQWTLEALKAWGFAEALRAVAHQNGHHTAPPKQLHALWAHNVINWTPEYGTMLSPAAHVITGQVREIEHRLWRGQVPLLLPLVDSLRLALCDRWTARYGPSWPTRWLLPEHESEARAVRDDPRGSGWGHIITLLRDVRDLQKERMSLRWVNHARYVRNELAHYRPVQFTDFEMIWRASEAERW